MAELKTCMNCAHCGLMFEQPPCADCDIRWCDKWERPLLPVRHILHLVAGYFSKVLAIGAVLYTIGRCV